KRQSLSVLLQERANEAVNRRERAGGLARGKDDEILILLVFDFQFVVVIIAVVIRRARRLCRSRRLGHDRLGNVRLGSVRLGSVRLDARYRAGCRGHRKLVVERQRGRIGRGGRLVVRGRLTGWLGRHEIEPFLHGQHDRKPDEWLGTPLESWTSSIPLNPKSP